MRAFCVAWDRGAEARTGRELPGKGQKPGQKPRKAVSQWSTFESGPLAPWEKCGNRVKSLESREPVDHSVEWTTSFWEKCRNLVKSPKNRELVDHSVEWSTSCWEKCRNLVKSSEKS